MTKVELVEFFDGPAFEDLCDRADWEVEWVRDVVRGILGIRPMVRSEIARQSAEMLKTLARRG